MMWSGRRPVKGEKGRKVKVTNCLPMHDPEGNVMGYCPVVETN